MRFSLIASGVHYRDAFQLRPDEWFDFDESWALTFIVGIGTANGGEFDWAARKWKAPK